MPPLTLRLILSFLLALFVITLADPLSTDIAEGLELELNINNGIYQFTITSRRFGHSLNIARQFCLENVDSLGLTDDTVLTSCAEVVSSKLVKEVRNAGFELVYVDEREDGDENVRVHIPLEGQKASEISFDPVKESINSAARRFCRQVAEQLSLESEQDISTRCLGSVRRFMRHQLDAQAIVYTEDASEDVANSPTDASQAKGVVIPHEHRRPTGFIRANVFLGGQLHQYFYDVDTDRTATARKYCSDNWPRMLEYFESIDQPETDLDQCTSVIKEAANQLIDDIINKLIEIM